MIREFPNSKNAALRFQVGFTTTRNCVDPIYRNGHLFNHRETEEKTNVFHLKGWGETPEKPYSGNLMLRVPPEVHAHAAMMAEAHGKSLNQWAAEVLGNAH